jgi:hypothetical protein
MKSMLALVGAGLMLAGSVLGQGSQIMFQDDFNDNMRDTFIWRAKGQNGAALAERNGRLYYASPYAPGSASWISKTPYNLLNGDTISIEAAINSAPRSTSDPADSFGIGLGFYDQFPNPQRWVRVSLMQSMDFYFVYVECFTGSTIKYRTFPISPVTRSALSLRYSTLTGKIYVVHQPAGGTAVEIGRVPLNRWWGLNVGEIPPLVPAVMAHSSVPVNYANKVFADDVVVTIAIIL